MAPRQTSFYQLSHTQKKATYRAAVIVSIFTLGFVAFLTIYSAIVSNTAAHIDMSVMQWMISHRTPLLIGAMEFITIILSPIGFAIAVTAGSAFWMWHKKEYWRPLLLLGAMATAFIIASTIKDLVARARPPIEHMVLPLELDFAFPSGHAIGIAVLTLVLGYLIYSRRRTAKVLAAWLLISIFSIVIVAFSRLYLGYHWLSDVSASVSLALMILAAVMTLDNLQPKQWTTTKAANNDR